MPIRFFNRVSVCILILLQAGVALCQDELNYGPEPAGGISRLAVEYFKINFTPEQRSRLGDTELELIYFINEGGNAALEKINGITDEDIVDSLREKTKHISKFQPQIVDGKPVSSVYFMKLQFPQYESISPRLQTYNHRQYRKLTLDDLESYTKGGRLDILIGGMMNSFEGKVSSYLGTGGGGKIDLMYIGRRGQGYGIVMDIYGNKAKKDYPIITPRPQVKAPPTLLIGVATNRRLMEQDNKEMTLQLELCYAIQNIVTSNSSQPDYVQLKGFSPGLLVNYILQIGKSKMTSYYGDPTLSGHCINFHAGVRPILFDLKEASGLMWELGIAYRLKTDFITDFIVK